jgi:aminopeptidase N
MSAIEQDGLQGMDGQSSFEFAQKVAVPSYVIALVVGDLQTKKVGDRVNVITEPGQMAEVSDQL